MTNLQSFLTEKQMNVSQLARAVDMAIPPVWRMVNGQQPVSDAFRWRFLQAFGADEAVRIFGNGHSEEAHPA